MNEASKFVAVDKASRAGRAAAKPDICADRNVH